MKPPSFSRAWLRNVGALARVDADNATTHSFKGWHPSHVRDLCAFALRLRDELHERDRVIEAQRREIRRLGGGR